MSEMFWVCSSLTSLILLLICVVWFSCSSSLISLNIIINKYIDMNSIFYNCISINSLNLSKFNVDNIIEI